MSENWAIAIAGFGFTLLSGAFIFLASKIEKLSDKLETLVGKDECRADMGEHCRRLEQLKKQVERNTADCIRLKAQMRITEDDGR